MMAILEAASALWGWVPEHAQTACIIATPALIVAYFCIKRYIAHVFAALEKSMLIMIWAQLIVASALTVAFIATAVINHPDPTAIEPRHLVSEALQYAMGAWVHLVREGARYVNTMRYSCVEGCSASPQ